MTQVAAKLGMLLTPTCFMNFPCCLKLDRCREDPPTHVQARHSSRGVCQSHE